MAQEGVVGGIVQELISKLFLGVERCCVACSGLEVGVKKYFEKNFA